MADNYYDATGVLILDRVTPVITALFGAFSLDADYPGDGEAYIARLSECSDPLWDDVLERLVDLANTLGRPLPEGDEDGMESHLRVLAKHFHVEEREDLENLIEHHPFEDCADLEALFLMATCFDDGHGLKAIKFEGAWHCNKPRLFEFGGEGRFLSQQVSLSGTSSHVLNLGSELRHAVMENDLESAATLIAREALHLAAGITDEAFRASLPSLVAHRLLEEPNSDAT